ncbi:MAG: HupE/UreJ family protein, partial [Deefgea sp.]
LPSAEYVVSLSVGLLGLTLLLSRKLSNLITTSIIVSSGLLHGVVHGAEIPNNTQSTSFVIGMLIASAVLHLGGLIWLSWGIKHALPYFQRISALGLTLSSVFLMLSL